MREKGGRGFMNKVWRVLVFGILGRDAVWELFRGSVGAVGAEGGYGKKRLICGVSIAHK